MEMGKRIRDLRIQHGMTQEELGEKFGVQKSAVAKWESGRVRNLKASTIKKMAELFGVKPSYVMGWDDTELISTELMKAMSLTEGRFDITVSDIELFRTYMLAKQSDKAAVKALITAVDKVLGLDEQENE